MLLAEFLQRSVLATLLCLYSGYGVPLSTLAGLVAGYIPMLISGVESQDGYIWPEFQRWSIWKFISWYHRSEVLVEEALNSKQQYIFCMFPHGACSVNHFLTMTDSCGMLSRIYTGERRDLVASVLFLIPVVRELLLFLGCVDAASKTAKYNLDKGRSLFIYIGGEKEQLMTEVGKHKVYLKSRKGFVKLALAHGCPLVPMYAFGENDCYSISNVFFPFRKMLQEKFQLGIPIFWGRWGTLVPHPVKLCVEIGKPILVNKVEENKITNQMIDELHNKFQKELIRLFERTKGKYIDPALLKDSKLEIL